jgi:uncharacterized cupredoxin-like copper-binding protein
MSGNPRALSRVRTALLAGWLVALALAGCGGSAKKPAAVAIAAVSERDFHIAVPATLKAGDVELHVDNHGPDGHELIVARLHGAALPMRADGFTVDEDAIEDTEAGALEPGRPGVDRTLTVHLAPGRYVFFCNMAGHYLGGMRKTVDVVQ